MPAMFDLAQQTLALTGKTLSATQLGQLKAYEDALVEWNARFNLTAIRDRESIRIKHFLDSFSCVLAWEGPTPHRLIDIGTGAGFPGLPLKILDPSIELTLVESVGKKAAFCQHVSEALPLPSVSVLKMRAEDAGWANSLRENFDCAVARAVADLRVLAEFLLPLVQVGGIAIAMKGSNGPAEAQQASHALEVLGGTLHRIIPVHVPGLADERFLIVMQKRSPTPPAYPRRPGLPAKLPL